MIYNITRAYSKDKQQEVAFVNEWVDSIKEHTKKCVKILENLGCKDIVIQKFIHEE